MTARAAKSAWGISILVIVSVVFIGLNWMWSGEVETNRYRDYAHAQSDEAFRRGWLPPFLPRSATDIVESHDLDTNTSRAKFRFRDTDHRFMEPACASVSAADVIYPREIPSAGCRWDGAIAWWNVRLSAKHRNKPNPGFRLYRCEDGFLAVGKRENVAHYWNYKATQ